MFGTRANAEPRSPEAPDDGAMPSTEAVKDEAMRFTADVTWRISQRGLIVCEPGGVPLLIEHDRAAELPELIADACGTDELVASLGGTEADRSLVEDLLAERILVDPSAPPPKANARTTKRVTFSRSGIEFTGIDPIARAIHRIAWPVLRSWPGRIVIAAILVGGVVSLILSRPAGPQVSQHPWVDATVGLLLGLALAGAHELAHAVALVHYGRTPRAAGCGFYWGALCFYVDSSDGMTLPRRARIINALAGLAVDLFTASILLTLSHTFAGITLIAAVCWRVAVTQLIGVVENGLPILEVDGHVAFSDYLDEPDLSPRSREALAKRLRGHKGGQQPSWLAAYGAFSLIGGIVLIATSTWVWWLAAGDLIKSLLSGNPVEILLGLYILVPLAIGVLFSTTGLLLEMLATKDLATKDKEPTGT
jgi:putative peptide zinc metalloprotease protein